MCILGYLYLVKGFIGFFVVDLWIGLVRYNRNIFVLVEVIIINNLDFFFGGMEIKFVYVFWIMWNVDVVWNEEEVEDFLEMIIDEVRVCFVFCCLYKFLFLGDYLGNCLGISCVYIF